MKSVLMSRWNTETALDLIEHERITFMVGPPTFFFGLMESRSFSSRRVRTLRLVSSGGAGVSQAFVDRAEAELGAHVKRTYGATEAPSVVTTGDHEEDEAGEPVAASEAELRVVDPETGKDQAPGREGELWLRGPELCAGYLDPAHTETAFARGGWFRTGDLAVIDPELGLSISGRLKDIIIRGGENISVAELEEVLHRNPSIRAAAVIGYPDERLGERVAAFVVARGKFDLTDCRHWFAQQGVAKYKWPERVQSLLTMPVLPSGKVDRHELRGYL
jgi:cyclohexanecarboxylate-CoA ligase